MLPLFAHRFKFYTPLFHDMANALASKPSQLMQLLPDGLVKLAWGYAEMQVRGQTSAVFAN